MSFVCKLAAEAVGCPIEKYTMKFALSQMLVLLTFKLWFMNKLLCFVLVMYCFLLSMWVTLSVAKNEFRQFEHLQIVDAS